MLHTTLLSNTPTTAVIAGSDATLVIDGPFYQPGGFTLRGHGGPSLRYDEEPVAHEALHFQAAEVARRITAGETGSAPAAAGGVDRHPRGAGRDRGRLPLKARHGSLSRRCADIADGEEGHPDGGQSQATRSSTG